VSDTALVWLVVGLLSTVVAIAFAVALLRHLTVLGRSLSRFQDEVEPLSRAIGEQSARASLRSSTLSERAPGAQRRGRR
jgi:hypothetical protein